VEEYHCTGTSLSHRGPSAPTTRGRRGGREQESRRAAPSRPDMGAGEQLHPAPTWEQESSSIPPRHGSTEDGGWRITGWKMIVSQPGGRSRWHVVMEYYCHIIGMEYYCNIIVREYQCWGRPSPHATPCSMVHVPWSMFHVRPLNPYLFLLLPLLLLRLLLPLLPPPQPGTLTRGTLTRTWNPNPDARVRRLAWRGWAGMGRGED
jgi:hypothetical protein